MLTLGLDVEAGKLERVAEHIADAGELVSAFAPNTRQKLEKLLDIGDGDEGDIRNIPYSRSSGRGRLTPLLCRSPAVDYRQRRASSPSDRPHVTPARLGMTLRQWIGDSAVPGRSYRLDLCHQVPESDSTYPQDHCPKKSTTSCFTMHQAGFTSAEPISAFGAAGDLVRVLGGVVSPAHVFSDRFEIVSGV